MAHTSLFRAVLSTSSCRARPCRRLPEESPMKSKLPGLLCVGILTAACSNSQPPAVDAGTASAPMLSGIDLKGMDTSARAGDDFYQYVNGNWLKTTEIPADKSAYGASSKLYDLSQDRLRGLIEDSEKSPADANQQKIAVLYSTFMNEAAIDELGAKPLD